MTAKPSLTVVPRRLSTYETVKGLMPPEILEVFLDACLESGISENDSIHVLYAFQAALLNRGFDAQNAVIKDILGKFTSDRSTENKELLASLQANQTASKDFTASIRQATLTTEMVAGRLTKDNREAKSDFEKALKDFHQQLSEQVRGVKQSADSVTNAAAQLKSFSMGVVWTWTAVTALATLLVTLVVEHFVFHL
jgi:uncharacterized alpha-E superfamily protein